MEAIKIKHGIEAQAQIPKTIWQDEKQKLHDFITEEFARPDVEAQMHSATQAADTDTLWQLWSCTLAKAFGHHIHSLAPSLHIDGRSFRHHGKYQTRSAPVFPTASHTSHKAPSGSYLHIKCQHLHRQLRRTANIKGQINKTIAMPSSVTPGLLQAITHTIGQFARSINNDDELCPSDEAWIRSLTSFSHIASPAVLVLFMRLHKHYVNKHTAP